MIPLRLAGWGIYTPRQLVPSLALDAQLGLTPGTVEAEHGIATRAIVAADETSSFMGAAAARHALDRVGWEPGAVDVLIGACGVMEQPIPSTSLLIQQRLGLGASGIPAFDVNQTCLSFLAALDVAALGMAQGRWRRALIVSADIASAGIDEESPVKTRAMFGDGAAAVALEAGPAGSSAGLLAARFASYGDHHRLARLEAGGTRIAAASGYAALRAGGRFHMDAFAVFKAAARRLPPLLAALYAEAGTCADAIAAVVPHQASAPALDHARRMFAPREDRVVDIFRERGNQIAASIPTALATLMDSGRVGPGDQLLLAGTAAGISIGGAILQL